MLTITVPAREFFDEASQTFYETKEYQLRLEHSLLSIDKWESKWHVSFIGKGNKPSHTNEQMLDYIRCMSLNIVPDEVYKALTPSNLNDIMDYINDPMTATTIRERPGSPMMNEVVTSTLIYYWMLELGIPFECEKWHINKLIMLIKVTSAKRNPKKMSKSAIMRQNHALNKARRARLGSKG